MSIALLMTMLHAAGSLALERAQRTLISLLIAPMSLMRVTAEYACGAFWRYRGLFVMILILLLVSIVIDQAGSLLWYPLIFLSQLACYTMLGAVHFDDRSHTISSENAGMSHLLSQHSCFANVFSRLALARQSAVHALCRLGDDPLDVYAVGLADRVRLTQ